MKVDLYKLFTPGKIGNLELKNRIIKAGCFEGMSQNGEVSSALKDHHRKIVQGNVAMTTLAYCSVSSDGRAFDHEIWMHRGLIPDLKELTRDIHNANAAISIQLGHCGYFASKKVIGKRPIGASSKFNLFRMSYCREMSQQDIEEKIKDFAAAASMAMESGFDALEIHAGHGYLLSQFISPYTNKRKDKYGGSLENRLRFPLEVIKRIRKMVGPDFPVLIKMNIRDGIKNGLQLNEAIEVARAFEKAGASALVPSSGFTSKTPFLMLRGNLPIAEMVANQTQLLIKTGLALFGKFMVKEYNYSPLFHLNEAKKIRDKVNIPVIYIGGVKTKKDIQSALGEGFDFVQVGRALIHDSELLKHWQSNKTIKETCDTCNRCIAAMDSGGVYCVSKEKGYQ